MISPGIERVFGRSRVQMRSRPLVEVFREAAAPGERRRYTKRFLMTAQGDFRAWTAREARIIARAARLGVRCVPLLADTQSPDVMQTFDAGVTVEDWATLLPLQRDGHVLPHVFADCGHWWALACHALRALEALHAHHFVHLDVRPDNVCVPVLPGTFDPHLPDATIGLQFARLAFIDLAFASVPGEPPVGPSPIVAEPEDPYRSPRLIDALASAGAGDWRAMQALDWRCDLYSVAAMLRSHLPRHDATSSLDGWTVERLARATDLLKALDLAHDQEAGAVMPHQALIEMCEDAMADADIVASLVQGFVLAPDAVEAAAVKPSTPARSLGRSPPRVETQDAMLAGAPASSEAMDAPSVVRNRSQILAARRAATAPSKTLARAALARSAQRTTARIKGRSQPEDRTDPGDAPGPAVTRKRAQIVVTQRALAKAAAATPRPRSTRATRRAAAPAIRVDEAARTRVGGSIAQAAASTVAAATGAIGAPPSTEATQPRVRMSHAPRAWPRSAWPGTIGAAVALALIVAVGVALFARHRSQADTSVARDDGASTVASADLTPTGDRAATGAAPATGARNGATEASPPPGKRAADELPVDAATAQRAAQDESRDGPASQARDEPTTVPDPSSASLPSAPPAPQAQPAPTAPSAPGTRAAQPVQSAPASKPTQVAQPAPAANSMQPAESPATARSAEAAQSAPAQPVQPTQPAQSARNGSSPPSAAQSATGQPAPVTRPDRTNEPATVPIPDRAVDEVVARTERGVARVLSSAASAAGPSDEAKVTALARSIPAVGNRKSGESATLARRLNAQARSAWDRNQDIDTALKLQQRAFAANPGDPEVAGNLAFFYLKTRPARPDLARRLALYALAARGPAFPAGRSQDWGTLAVASSLEGREADAVKAMYVMLAVSRNPDWACRSARLAVAQYGDAMKTPAHAMLSRVRARGAAAAAPNCA